MTSARADLGARLARLAPGTPATDADLLARFVAARDEAAFAELVRRHGPAVLAACRRITGHAHDAEDAFQATFLVLASRADRVRPGEPVGAWLYGVAVRVARKAARRREVLGGVPDMPERPAELFDADAGRAVLEEVGRLSPRYRAAVVLCELEGRSRAAAARELGIAPGTLSSRLAAARKELADRLAARGFGPTALVALAPAVVPPALAATAAALPGGRPAPAGVAALSHGALRPMFRRTLTLVLLAVAGTAVVATGLFAFPPAIPPTPPIPTVWPVAAPAPELPVGPSQILVWRDRELIGIDPDGRNEKVYFGRPDGWAPQNIVASPDGRRVAVAQRKAKRGDDGVEVHLVVRGLGAKDLDDDLAGFLHTTRLAWGGDGNQIAATTDIYPHLGSVGGVRHVLIHATTGAQTPLKLPEDHILMDWSRDGRHFLTRRSISGGDLWLMDRDGAARKPLIGDVTSSCARLSPDGRRVLARVRRPDGKASRLVVVDVAGGGEKVGFRSGSTFALSYSANSGAVTTVIDEVRDIGLHDFCWSPDGRRVACVWYDEPTARETISRLIVCDPDGKNRRTILSQSGPPDAEHRGDLRVIDWR
ncbi:MAG TPA: sigma-70 family RNA polymerase sigma factor [Urbifossiella sp.]|jgi:RNA polymerase sigma factor (sigma-70 family)|nr:sigma-70 family RNA polymerase sigma factor [Urbifossiella sp.]